MAEGQFNPDLLLTVGADITALRQQLAQIGRELNLPPVQIRVEAQAQQVQQQAQQISAAFNEASRGAGSLTREMRDLVATVDQSSEAYRRLIQLQIQASTEDRGRVLRQIAAEKEYQAVLQQRGRIVVAAVGEDEARTRATALLQIAAAKELQATIQQSGRMRAEADAADEARTRRLGVTQVSAEREYQAEIRRTSVVRQEELNKLQALQSRLNLLLIRNPGAGSPETAQLQATIAGLTQTVTGGGKIEPTAIKEVQGALAGMTGSMAAAKAEAVATQGVLDHFFTRFGRYTQFIIGATIAGAGFAAAFATFKQVEDTDRILKLIEATADRTTDRLTLLRVSYDLIVEGNQKLGISFKESGQTVFELQKALNGSAEEIRGAFLPALALTSLGEGNQKEIIRTLIGVYELFGDTLAGTTTPMEKFAKISDTLIAASVSSIADVDGFRAALATVAPSARSANLSLDATVSLLAVLQNGLQSAQRAGTGLSRLIRDIQENGPRIGKIFEIPIDINKPIDVLNVLLQVAQKLRDAGPLTEAISQKIKQAFGDERAERALLTLVQLLPQFNQMLDETSNSAGRTQQVVDTLGQTLQAALGRLGGRIFDEINQGLAYLQGIDPGKADGVVKFIDRITDSIRGLALMLRAIRSLPGDIAAGAQGEAARVGAERGAAAAKTATPAEQQEIYAAAARAGITFVPTTAAGPPSPIYGPPSPIYGPPSPTLRDRKAELADDIRRIQAEAQTAVDRNNPFLSFDIRIKDASAEVARVFKETQDAADNYANARFGKTGDQDAAKKTLLAAYEKLGRAQLEVIKLQRQEAEEGAKAAGHIDLEAAAATRQVQELLGHISQAEDQIAKLTLSNAIERSFLDADFSAEKFNDTVKKIGESLATELNFDTDKLRGLQGKLFDTPGLTPEQISQQYDRISQLIAAKTGETYSKVGDAIRKSSLSASAAELQKFEQEFATGTAAKLTTSELQAIADKSSGLDKVTESIRAQIAVFGLWGAEAAMATAAAAKGFSSFADLVEKANTTQQPTLLALVEDIRNLGKETTKSGLATINTQIDQQTRVLDAARGVYGQAGVESEKYSLALSILKTSYDRLDPVERERIDALAEIVEQTKAAAAASGLARFGFGPDAGEAIGRQANEIQQVQQQRQAAIDAFRTINEEQKRAQDQQDQFIQETARASGSFAVFFIAALRQAGNAAGDFWDNLKTLAEDTAKNMQTSFSDFFFDTFTGKLQTATQLWSNFLTSMLRALSDFMSKQLVRSFLNILLGGGGAGGGAGAGGAGGIAEGAQGLLGGAAGGFANIFSNASEGGLGGALFGLPATPNVVRTTTSTSDQLRSNDQNLTQNEIDIGRRVATTGILGTGGNISKDLSSAGAVLAAYTAAQSVIKLTSDLSTQRDRNSGTGGLVGTGVGGVLGAFFGSAQIGAGAGGLLGSFLGGLFGSNAPPAGRFDEINRTISTVQTSLEAMIAGAHSFTDLFNTLLSVQGGGALAGATRQPVGISVGGVPISSLTQSQFLSAVRANPSSLQAGVQAGVNPSLLGPLNQEVVSAILTRISALDQIGQQINKTIADILAETVVPTPTGQTSLETLKQQAVDFRAVVDQLIATNVSQTQALEQQLAVTTDPALVLQYTTTIKGLIEQRYQDETDLVQKFAGQLDTLANSLKSVSASIDKQIFDLQLSNFGPTNPLAGYQLAQGKFDTAKGAFFASPTPENAQALQALVDPLLQAASQVFTRPSPEYRAIYDDVINTLEQVKASVDSQASDIRDALTAALGTSNSIQDLTQKNTASMAADMKQLLAIVTASAAASGISLNAGMGILLPGTFPAAGQSVQPFQNPASTNTGNQTTAALSAVGVLGALGGIGSTATGIIGIADKLGITDWLKSAISGFFSNPTTNPATASNYFTGGGSDVGLVAPTLDSITAALSSLQISIPDITIPNLTLDFGGLGSYSFSDLGAGASFSDISALQSGGHVPGMGSGDIVPAMLEPGEFVIPKRIAGPMRPLLEHLIGGNKNIPTGPRGLHFADGGAVPLTAQDVQALLLLQALLGANNNQTLTQQQIAANTQLTAAILQQLAQRSGVSISAASPTNSFPSTPSVTGLTLPSTTTATATRPVSLAQILTQILQGATTGLSSGAGTTAIRAFGTATGAVSPSSSPSGGISISGGTNPLLSGGTFGGFGQNLPGTLTAISPILKLLSTISAFQGGASGAMPTDPGTLSSILGLAGGGLNLFQGVSSNNIFQTLSGGVSTAFNLYNLLSSIAPGTFTPLSSVLNDALAQIGGALGTDLSALGGIGASGYIQAVVSAIQIAQIATSNQSDQDKAIHAAEQAAIAAGAIAAPATFGASLAIVQIVDFIERLRAGQSLSKAIVGANDPTATLGITFPNSSEPGISGALSSPSMDWVTFGTRLAENFQKGGLDLQRMVGMVQYVQSKEELGAVLNSFRTWVQSDNGWSWYGQDTPDPYKIPAFPEAGGSAHEGGLSISFSDPINQIQALIDQLLQILPGDRITSLGYFNTGLAGKLQSDVFLQAHPEQAGALQQIQAAQGFSGESTNFATQIVGNALPIWQSDGTGGITATQLSATDIFNGIAAGTVSGTPVYDPRTGQYGYVMAGTTAAMLGIPDATSLLAPYFQNFGQTAISTAALTPPMITTISNVRPDYGTPEYWALHPDELQALQASFSGPDGGGGFAAGGWTSGSGIRGRDSIPTMLAPDEFVVPSNIARANAGLLNGLLNDGTVRPDYGSVVSTAAMSGAYRSAGGVSTVALNIHPGAIQIDGAKDPKAVSREVLDAIEQNIRTGRLGQVIVTRVRQQRS